MRIDLHAHTNASDGTDTPAEMVAAAGAADLDVVAITDHDTTGGWAAAEAALPAGLTLVRGAEFSTHLEDATGLRRSIHVLGYLFDPDDPVIAAEQRRLVDERLSRGLKIVDRMVADGVPITAEQVLAIAGGAPIGRPHIGRALMQAGLVDSVAAAFDTYLAGRGKYYVPKDDTNLFDAVAMISAAGGVPVIAHPRGRSERFVLDGPTLGELADAGLTGLEVDHPDHDEAERTELAGFAKELGLVPTGSSDYHGTNKTLVLGEETTTPESLAALVAASSGRVPLVGPLAATFSR